MNAWRNNLGTAFAIACTWEATARKIGNVHPAAPFADVDFVSFIVSAAGCSWVIDLSPGKSVGLTVDHAVQARMSVCDANTNLGILLLIAPLTVAHDRVDYRTRLLTVLAELSHHDAVCAFQAIRIANPGGLGDAPEQDVRNEPSVTLLDAMKFAADRDLIARQYANGYADVFDLGVPAFVAAFEKFGRIEPAVVECQLKWMAAFPDSLIARKRGLPAAEDVQRRVQNVLDLGGLDTPTGRAAGVALDRYLRSDGNKLNPGTTADLVTACLFVALREGRVAVNAPFHWDVPDWL